MFDVVTTAAAAVASVCIVATFVAALATTTVTEIVSLDLVVATQEGHWVVLVAPILQLPPAHVLKMVT